MPLDTGGWADYLAQFRREVYPLFRPYGFTLPEAHQLYQTNCLENGIRGAIKDAFTEPKEDWEQ